MQLCSWALFLASIYLAIEGIRLLRKVGRPSDELEATTVLVEVGVYMYIRHPLYASFLPLVCGTLLKNPALLATGLAVTVCVCVVVTAKAEEELNLRKFGGAYAEYMRHTKMFIPYLL